MARKAINRFNGKYAFLSNFSLVRLHYEEWTYQSVENAFQAQKSLDPNVRFDFRWMQPWEAKREGYKVKLRSDWEEKKVQIMRELLRLKFEHPSLAKLLLETGDAFLEEGNKHHDQVWGVCYCKKHKGVGRNFLGALLMEVRAELKAKQKKLEEAYGKV